ncbi:MAG: caspase family protein, partial [Cyanobacteria bacterium J06621_3]
MSALDFDKNLAVVIGIDQYVNGITPLRTAVADARSVAYMLEQEHDYQVLLLLDQHAELANLQELIQQTLPSLLSANSRLLFYFAGHGIAQDGDDGPAGYLIPQDAVPGNVGGYLSMVSLHDELTVLPCRHFLAIFDCCFAGAFRWSSTREITVVNDVIHRERYDRFRQDPAWQVITSASYDQRAMDVLSLRDERGEVVDSRDQQCHSPFAAALMQALKGDADSSPPARNGKPAGDGVITATELYLYLRDQVEVLTERLSVRQTPEICTLRNHDKGEFIFLTPGHTLNLPPAPELNKENNPYRGLESFDQAHKDLFFGRDEEIARLLKRLNDPHPMTVVLGASGTGKSSLVKAGLLPQLADNSKYQVLPVMRPGNSPLEALSRACRELALGDGVKALTHQFETDEQSLARLIGSWQQGRANQPANAKLVLVIDQAEELITQANTPEESTQFQRLVKRAMAEHWRYFRVVATLRLDFEAQFQDEELKEGWMDSRFVIPPMSQAQLRDAIEKPAEARVLYFEPSNLVDKLVEDVAQTPGALPLLSFTLSELYLRYLDRRSDNRALTEEDYRALGGVTGALKERATQEYEMLLAKDAAYEKTVKHVMLRMVAVEGGELARRRVPLSELVYSSAAENERVDTLLENLIKARLLVRGQEGESEPYVEPAHDALVRGWDRLLRWKNEEQVSLGLQRELTPQARNWQAERATGKQRKANGFLWNGNPRLDLLKETLKSDASWLNVLETKFVQRSLERKRNRLGFGVAMTVSVMVALGGLAFFGFNQALKAEANAVEAEKNADEAEANAVEAEKNAREAEANAAEAEENAREAKANADEALKNQKEAEKNALEANQQQQRAEEALERAEAGEAEARQQTELAEKETKRAQYQEAVALLREQAARVLNLLPTNDAVSGLVIAIDTMARSQSVPAVEMVAQSSLLKAVQISQEMNRLEGHESEVLSLAFSPDGQRIVSGSKDGTLRFWDAQTGVPLSDLLKGHESEVWSVAFSLDNQRIVSGGRDGIRLWDAQTGALLSDPLEGHGWVDSVAFSPDGQRIVSSGRGGRSRLWDAQTGAPIGAPLEDYGVAVLSVTFSPDGQRIVSGSKDGTLRFWDAQTSASLGASIEGNGSTVWSMAFSPDGQRIVSGSEDGTLRLRDTQTGARSASTEGNGSTVWSVAFSPDGQRIVSGSEDGTL